MRVLISILFILGATLSLGTLTALADGGETGADAAHTQPYWPGYYRPDAPSGGQVYLRQMNSSSVW